MRVFIGIEFDAVVKEYLYKLQNVIKPGMVRGDFTNFNNFHLTLKYIGHIDEEDVDILKEIIDEVSIKYAPFILKLNGINSFKKGNGDILFVSLLDGKKQTTDLFNDLEDLTILEGFEESSHKKFRPHITICKKVQLKNGGSNTMLPHYYDEITVSKITLFHSHRVNNILTYTPIYRKELEGE